MFGFDEDCRIKPVKFSRFGEGELDYYYMSELQTSPGDLRHDKEVDRFLFHCAIRVEVSNHSFIVDLNDGAFFCTLSDYRGRVFREQGVVVQEIIKSPDWLMVFL